MKAELRRRLHDPVPEVGKWLRSVFSGHIHYYGVPMNYAALSSLPLIRSSGSGIALCRGAARKAG